MQPGAKQGGAKGLGPETTGFTGAGHRGERRLGHAIWCEQQAVVGPVRKLSGLQLIAVSADEVNRDGTVLPRRHRPAAILAPPEASGRRRGIRLCPVQQVRTGHKQQPGQGSAITSGDGIEAMTLGGPAVLGRQHHQQTAAIAQHEQIGDKQEHRQVSAVAIDITEHPQQAARQGAGVKEGEHAGIGAQGIAEEAGRPGGFDAAPIGERRLLVALGQVDAAAAGAFR